MSAASPRMALTDYETRMRKKVFYIPRKVMAAILIAGILLVGWGIYQTVPLIVKTIDVPVVYRSYSTNQVTRIEIGRDIYTPESDPQWKIHVEQVLAGRYEPIHVK